MRDGLLLVNLGTPDAPRTPEVRRYLREFLGDPYVLTMPAVARWLLLNLIILPRRPKQSAEAYASIWTEEGSPLLVNSVALAKGVQAELGDDHPVELGMRYGSPSLADALARLHARGAERLTVIPLYPQFANATTTTTIERVKELLGGRWRTDDVRFVEWFHGDPGFLEASEEVIRPVIDEASPDHVLFSYHGLPESQIRDADPSGTHCLASADCCAVLGDVNRRCYRAQCLATSRDLARRLDLEDARWSSAFQSRLGRTPWIRPYTDERLAELARDGVRNLVVVEPSFTADCLETLEELGIRGRETFLAAGGETFTLAPCVNAHPRWVRAVADLARRT